MSEPFIGQIQAFGFNFAPMGWALCNGQLLSIQQYTALFSLIGATYGGNGTTNFAVPDLQGRVAISQGAGTGLTVRTMGNKSGDENVGLTTNQMPQHNHTVAASSSAADQASPAGAICAAPQDSGPAPGTGYTKTASNAAMAPAMIGSAGLGAARVGAVGAVG